MAATLMLAAILPAKAQNLDPRTDEFWSSLNLASRLSAAIGRTDLSAGGESDSSFAGHASSSTAFQFYGLNFQSNSNFLYDDYSEGVVKTYGSSLHINRRDPMRYMLGVNLARHTLDISGDTDEVEIDRIGVEGEYYRDRLTIGGAVGYTEYSSDDPTTEDIEGHYFKLLAKYYIHDDFKIEGYYGKVDLDGGHFDYGSVAAHTRLPGTTASLFARWNGVWVDGSDGEANGDGHQFLLGVKLDLGNARNRSLIENDRTYFTDACLLESGVTPFC
jgi:hypothetical protein